MRSYVVSVMTISAQAGVRSGRSISTRHLLVGSLGSPLRTTTLLVIAHNAHTPQTHTHGDSPFRTTLLLLPTLHSPPPSPPQPSPPHPVCHLVRVAKRRRGHDDTRRPRRKMWSCTRPTRRRSSTWPGYLTVVAPAPTLAQHRTRSRASTSQRLRRWHGRGTDRQLARFAQEAWSRQRRHHAAQHHHAAPDTNKHDERCRWRRHGCVWLGLLVRAVVQMARLPVGARRVCVCVFAKQRTLVLRARCTVGRR